MYSSTNKKTSQELLHETCSAYVSDVFSMQYELRDYAMAIARYILHIHLYLPLSCVIVVERPYQNGIHDEVFSAMSYSRRSSGPTPATQGMSDLLKTFCDVPPASIESWFQHSWKYLCSGVVLINICYAESFMSPDSQTEKALFQRFLRSLLVYGSEDGRKISVVPMGNPARATVNQVLGSLGRHRSQVVLRRMANPAQLSHGDRDSRSQRITSECPGTLKYLASIIEKSIYGTTLSYSDFCLHTQSLRIMEDATSDIVQKLRKISQELKEPIELPKETLSQVVDRLADCISTFSREMVKANVAMTIANSKPPEVAGRSTAWGQRPSFKKGQIAVGESIKVDTPSVTSVARSMGGFADDDDGVPLPSPAPRRAELEPTQADIPRSVVPLMTTPTKPSIEAQPPVTQPAVARPTVTSPVNMRPVPAQPIGTQAPTVASRAVSMSMGGFDDESDENTPTDVALPGSKPVTAQGGYVVPKELRRHLRMVAAYVNDHHATTDMEFQVALFNAIEGRPADERAREICDEIRALDEPIGANLSSILGYSNEPADMDSNLFKVLKTYML